jgi:hypothetical protein
MRKLFFGLALTITACAGNSPPSPAATSSASEPSVCEELATLCHEHDKSGPVAHECHVLGHSKESTEEQCRAKRPECIQACSPAQAPPAASGADAGQRDTTGTHEHSGHEH